MTNIIAQATSSARRGGEFHYDRNELDRLLAGDQYAAVRFYVPFGTTTVTASTAYHLTSVISGKTNTTFTVTVLDTQSPVITMLGANPLTNFVDHYLDPGATATGPVYGNLTGSIIVSGDLNANVPGTYTVTYSVTSLRE